MNQKIITKIMDYLARRDHSEKELKQKLKQHFENEAEIVSAIEFAKKQNWFASPEVLSERYSQSLHRKNKGIRFINAALKDKGLPSIKMDPEVEIEKAQKLISAKFRKEKSPEKIYRFLQYRGFDQQTIKAVLNDLK